MLITSFLTLSVSLPVGEFVQQIDGFLEPVYAIELPDGGFAVADRMADEVVLLDASGKRIGTIEGPVDNPTFLEIDTNGNVHVATNTATYPKWSGVELRSAGVPVHVEGGWIVPDRLGHAIHHFDESGNWLSTWGAHAVLPHEGHGKLHYPDSVTLSNDRKRLIVCEGFEGRIQIFERTEGDPEAPPPITNIAHFGKYIDSYGDLLVIAEPEMGDVYLFRTGLEVPIQLTRFGGEGKAPHQFTWVEGVWIGDGVIKIVGDKSLKTFTYEHDKTSRMRAIPGMVKFQESVSNACFQGAIDNDVVMPSASDIAVSQDGATMWVVHQQSETVQLLSTENSEPLITIEGFVEPQGVALEQHGTILVSDIGASHIKRFSPDGSLLLTFGEKGIAPHQMNKPAGITVLDDGTIAVVDWGNHRAQLYAQDGTWLATFGRGRFWTNKNVKK
ncbi:MAG: hypothetical protein QGI78_08210 [Phycisphaerales bacterium]|nr:hypothetical protein [Phycisphaerales bacterium]